MICFLARRLCFEKMDTVACNREVVNSFEIGELRFLTRNKQTMTLQHQLNRPCAFFCLFVKNHIKCFDVALQHSLRPTGNQTQNGSKKARFTPVYFFEMAILYFH